MSGFPYAQATSPLGISDAVAAIILIDDSRYLLQLRDPLPHIWYPDHWGAFGGAVDPGESDMETLRRELREELNFEFQTAELFARFDFDLTPLGKGRCYRSYYVVRTTAARAAGFVLNEGAAMRAFSPEEMFGGLRLSPYDSFAFFLHHSKARLR